MLGAMLLNRYRLEAELGQGAMGTVYRAQDVLLDRPVAIKVLTEARLGAEGRARLLHEARAVARLNHPNIIAIYDVADTGAANGAPAAEPLDSPAAGGQVFIVMEVAGGGTPDRRGPGQP